MATTIPGSGQLFTAEDQLEHARIIREFFGPGVGDHRRYDQVMSPNIRLFVDSYPTDPVVWGDNQVHIGPESMKQIYAAYADKGFSYDIEIHDIFTCGPVVVVSRTDTRKEQGQPAIPFPAVGVFAFRDRKIVEWSDYYR